MSLNKAMLFCIDTKQPYHGTWSCLVFGNDLVMKRKGKILIHADSVERSADEGLI